MMASKKNRHVKARQAAQARAARNIKQLGAYTHANLSKTADKQLVNIAQTIAKEWDRQKRVETTKAQNTTFISSPIVKPDKRIRMFAQRVPPTQAQIDAEPIAKRRKLMRQQRRKILDAQAQVSEYNRIQSMPKQTVLERRQAEIAGTTGDQYGRGGIAPSKLTEFLTHENVLGDRAFVAAQLKGGHRKEVIKDIQSAAKTLGLNTGEKRKSNKKRKTTKKGRYNLPYQKKDFPKYMSYNRYRALEKSIAASMGGARLKQFRALSKSQRRALVEQSDFAKSVFNWIESPTGRITSRFGQDKQQYQDARKIFDGWLKTAKQLA